MEQNVSQPNNCRVERGVDHAILLTRGFKQAYNGPQSVGHSNEGFDQITEGHNSIFLLDSHSVCSI
jgi:hypothetical protein